MAEESEDDVLLVSDWDEDADGTLLHDYHIVDPSTLVGEPGHASSGRTIAVAKLNGMGITGGSTGNNDREGGDEDEDVDVDVLLVGDYEPDTEEEATIFGMSLPLPGADGWKTTESTEVRFIYCDGINLVAVLLLDASLRSE